MHTFDAGWTIPGSRIFTLAMWNSHLLWNKFTYLHKHLPEACQSAQDCSNMVSRNIDVMLEVISGGGQTLKTLHGIAGARIWHEDWTPKSHGPKFQTAQ